MDAIPQFREDTVWTKQLKMAQLDLLRLKQNWLFTGEKPEIALSCHKCETDLALFLPFLGHFH
jgi:hypothetical protein